MARQGQRALYEHLVEELGAAIASDDIKPGALLDVASLEERHGVSRTVVREAIRVLATKGLVDARPKRGTFVLEREDWNMLDADVIAWRYGGRPDADFLDSLDEVRQILEPAGARLAASRRSAEDLEHLRAALAGMADAKRDVEAAIAADLRFHRTLLEATHNDMLRQLGSLLIVGMRARDLLALQVRFHTDIPGHSAVLDAIEEGDPERSEAAMHELLLRAAQDARAALRRSARSRRRLRVEN